MPNTNDTKILLNIKDENIDIVKPIEEKKVNGVTTIIAYGKLTYTPECCLKCGVVNESALDVIKYGFKQATIKLNPNNHRKCLLKLKKQRFYCKHCHGTFTAETSLVKKHCQISNPVRNAIAAELSLVGPMTSIAKRQQVSASTVIRLLVEFAKPLETKQIHLPEHLSIDEFKSVAAVDGAMSFNFIDAMTHRFIDVVENRQLHALESYFMRYPKASRFAVKTVCMDMYSPYMTLVKRCFPNAVIIIDRFHIIQHLNRALNSYRIQVMNDIRYTQPTDYRKLKKLWKLVLKNREDLDFSNYKSHRLFEGLMTEEMMVKYLLNIDERFALVYKLVNDLKFAIKHHHYERFIEVLEKSKYYVLPRKVRTTFNTLMFYKDEIYYSCLYTISNGPIEGINNKIKNIKRSGYGYRNFGNFKSRILMCLKLTGDSKPKKSLYYEKTA